jgi:hypothetical protein
MLDVRSMLVLGPSIRHLERWASMYGGDEVSRIDGMMQFRSNHDGSLFLKSMNPWTFRSVRTSKILEERYCSPRCTLHECCLSTQPRGIPTLIARLHRATKRTDHS